MILAFNLQVHLVRDCILGLEEIFIILCRGLALQVVVCLDIPPICFKQELVYYSTEPHFTQELNLLLPVIRKWISIPWFFTMLCIQLDFNPYLLLSRIDFLILTGFLFLRKQEEMNL